MAEILWLIVPYALICSVVGTATYVLAEILGDSRHHHHHHLHRNTR